MKALDIVTGVWRLVAKYPAVSAGLAQIIILVGAQFGLHLTTGQLASIAGFVAGVFALLVHMGVIPVTKVDNVKAGVKPTVPADVEVTHPVSSVPADILRQLEGK